MAAGWEGMKAAGLSALEGTIAGVVSFGDRTAAIFQGAYDAAVAIWGSLPGAIGDFAFQALQHKDEPGAIPNDQLEAIC